MPMPVFLRVKRLRSEVPVESFETERLNKISRLDPKDHAATSTFRYIGTQSSESDVTDADLTELAKVTSQGSFKLVWNASSGKIVGKGVSSVPCVIQINNLKRPLCTDTIASGTDPPTVMPAKVMRIIDVIPADSSPGDLTDSLHAASLNSHLQSESQSVSEQDDVSYMYDLYRLERRRHARSRSPDRSASAQRTRTASEASGADSDPLAVPYARDEIVFDADWNTGDRDSDGYLDDDEDDSNSESNWRNDYPDEEDVSSSNSRSSSDRSRDGSSDSDCSDRLPKPRSRDYWF